MSDNKIFNPKTGRKIKLHSSAYNQLIRDGFTIDDGTLKPPDTSLSTYVYSTGEKIYVKKNKKMYNTIIKDYDVATEDGKEIFKPKITDFVFGLAGTKIKRNSQAYNNLIDLGYTYNPETNRLIYPVEVEIFEIKNNDLPVGLIDKIRDNPKKYHHIFVEGDEYSNTLNLPKTTRQIRDWWYEEILYENATSIRQIQLYPNIKEVHFGPSYQGTKNCVITELENHYKNRDYVYDFKPMYSQFEEGVFETDFDELTKKLKMRISVIVGNKEYTYGKTRTNKAQLKLYYKNNHMTSVKTEYKDKQQEFVNSNDLQIDNFSKNCELSKITNVIKCKDITYAIETDEKIYRLKEDSGIDLEKEDIYSATTYYTRKFLEDNPHIRKIPTNHDNIAAIKSIIQNGINFNKHNKDGICIDLVKAYSNFQNFPEYSGFPTDLSQCVDCNNIDEKEIINIINTCEGYALCEMTDIFETFHKEIKSGKEDPYDSDDNLHVFDKKCVRWVSFPYVRHRLCLDVPPELNDVQIRYMMISKDKTDLNLEYFKLDDLSVNNPIPKRALHKVFGKLINTTVNDSFTTTDPLVGISYGGSMVYQSDTLNSRGNSCDQLFICNNYREKISDKYYYPHITGYVQQYTEIQMEKMYLQCLKLGVEVYRIWVDGITINPNDLDRLIEGTSIIQKEKKIQLSKNELWHLKGNKGQEFICKNTYVNGISPTKYSESFNPLLTNVDKLKNHKFVIMGEAGTGKTYNVRKLYNQFNNAIILLPKHNLKKDYPGLNCETIHMFIEKRIKSYDTIIIDEFAMISQEMLEMIEQIYEKTIILVGDFGQLKCINGTPINIQSYNIVMLEKNYRQKDKKFIELLRKTRETGDISWITQSVNKTEAVRKKFIVLSATHKEIDKINKIGDDINPNPPILFNAGVKQIQFKIDTPIRFYQTHKSETNNYCAGDMGTIININEEKKEITIDLKSSGETSGEHIVIPIKSFQEANKKSNIIVKKAYSITYHAVQGKTITQNIALNLARLFDKNMKYVGVSRATEYENIYILEN